MLIGFRICLVYQANYGEVDRFECSFALTDHLLALAASHLLCNRTYSSVDAVVDMGAVAAAVAAINLSCPAEEFAK